MQRLYTGIVSMCDVNNTDLALFPTLLFAASEDEATGVAIRLAMGQKPGYRIGAARMQAVSDEMIRQAARLLSEEPRD